MKDKLLIDGMTIYQAAAACGVPPELAELKKTPRKGFWRNEDNHISM